LQILEKFQNGLKSKYVMFPLSFSQKLSSGVMEVPKQGAPKNTIIFKQKIK
jgi:hypothetical protein